MHTYFIHIIANEGNDSHKICAPDNNACAKYTLFTLLVDGYESVEVFVHGKAHIRAFKDDMTRPAKYCIHRLNGVPSVACMPIQSESLPRIKAYIFKGSAEPSGSSFSHKKLTSDESTIYFYKTCFPKRHSIFD